MKRIVPILAVVVLAAVTVAAAQGGSGRHAMGPGPMMGGQGPHMGGPGGPGGVPFGEYLYPPELVLRNQIKIGLTEDQTASIKRLIADAHTRTIDLRVDLERATERSNVISDKGYHSACATSNDQVISVWQDKRMSAGGDMYLQNVNPDGTLGPFGATLADFDLIAPLNHDTLNTCYPIFIWEPCSNPMPEYPVNYEVWISHFPEFTDTVLIPLPTATDTTLTRPVCLVDATLYYWKVIASNGQLPAHASNQAFDVYIDEPEVGCPYFIGDINGNGSANGIDVS